MTHGQPCERDVSAPEQPAAGLVEGALAASRRLRFPPALEARFERDTGAERCRAFVRYGVTSLVLYDLFLLNYFSRIPDVAWRAALVQLGLVTPVCLAGIAYTRMGPPPFWREAIQALTALLSLVAAMAVYQDSTLPAAVFFRYSPVITALFVNVVVAVRFRFAVAASAAIVVCNMADLWRFEHATADVKLLIASSVVWTCAFTLLANHRLEREQRRTYLLRTRERQQEERIRHIAHHDPLTGLANRRLFQERMELALTLAAGRCAAGAVAVLCLDLDRFKAVNDTLGHAAGDLLLRQVAERLRAATRATDTVARIGGDEFIVMQAGVRQPEMAGLLAARLVEALCAPFDLAGKPANIGASVGIALYPRDGDDASELLRVADVALYEAKQNGRGTHRFYEPAMDAQARERREMEADLRAAFGTGQLAVHYQPILSCRGGTVTGFEALIRWTHPRHGPVPPAVFVPLAEEAGLIGPLGAWALEAACLAALSWPAACRVAVGLSPAQFRGGDLADTVADVLRRTGLAPGRLELAVTEDLLLKHPAEALAALRAITALGVRVALGDFGAGYSSLASLRRFPLAKLKLDRSLTQAVGERDGGGQAIVSAILAMARSLGLEVAAEGVETRQQLAALQALSCDQVQGHLLARPMPAGAVADYLQAARPNPAGLTDTAAVLLQTLDRGKRDVEQRV